MQMILLMLIKSPTKVTMNILMLNWELTLHHPSNYVVTLSSHIAVHWRSVTAAELYCFKPHASNSVLQWSSRRLQKLEVVVVLVYWKQKYISGVSFDVFFFFLVSCCGTGNCVLRLTCCLGLWKHFSVNLEKKFLWKKQKQADKFNVSSL